MTYLLPTDSLSVVLIGLLMVSYYVVENANVNVWNSQGRLKAALVRYPGRYIKFNPLEPGCGVFLVSKSEFGGREAGETTMGDKVECD